MEIKRKRGVSLIEVMVVIGLTLMVSIILGNVSTISRSAMEKSTDVSVVINKGKGAFEKFVKDANDSDMMLCQYPVNSTAVYTAADNSTVIFRQPTFDSSNEPVDNNYTIIVYRVTTTAVAAEGPFVLKRYKGSVVNGTENALVYEGVTAKNLNSATIQTAVNQQYWGDNSTSDFYLFTTPSTATPEIPTEFLVGGVDRLADGNATLAANKVSTVKPMKYGVRGDATYRIDPAYKVDSAGSNGGTSLYIKFTLAPQWKTIGRTTKSKDFVFTSQPSLQNSATNL